MARDYKKEYRTYQGKPEQIANRSERNKARRAMMKKGLAKKGDGMDVDHKQAIRNGGGNAASNLRMRSVKANRGYKRDAQNRPI